MAMGVRATLTGGALVEADRGCRRPHAGAVGAAEVGTRRSRHLRLLARAARAPWAGKKSSWAWTELGYHRVDKISTLDVKSVG